MMDTNENGSKRVLILVHPVTNAGGYSRPAKSFQGDQAALDYALEGDAILYVFEDSTVYPMIRGARSGAALGSSIAESYLYSGMDMDKSEILEMCYDEDAEAAKAFVNSLVDYVIECRAEREAEL
jgi:hypothetical protein